MLVSPNMMQLLCPFPCLFTCTPCMMMITTPALRMPFPYLVSVDVKPDDGELLSLTVVALLVMVTIGYKACASISPVFINTCSILGVSGDWLQHMLFPQAYTRWCSPSSTTGVHSPHCVRLHLFVVVRINDQRTTD